MNTTGHAAQRLYRLCRCEVACARHDTGAVTRRKSATEQRIRRCFDVAEAYRAHAESTRQKEEAAFDLGVDLVTFEARLLEARQMGFIGPRE